MPHMIARVTMQVDYLIHEDVQAGNGQTPEEIVKDWFPDDNVVNTYHATRDGLLIGGSKHVENVDIIPFPE